MSGLKVVGIITKNRALGSILAMILRDCEGTRVRQFESVEALRIYLAIAPIHLLVCDYQLEKLSCAQLISSLKSNPAMHAENMQTMVLTRDIDRALQREIGIAGIDEVIVKPTSPQYVFERVQARLSIPTRFRRVPVAQNADNSRPTSRIETFDKPHRDAGNIVSLFEHRRDQAPHPENA